MTTENTRLYTGLAENARKNIIQSNAKGEIDDSLLKSAVSEYEVDNYTFDGEDIQYIGESVKGLRVTGKSINKSLGDRCISVVTNLRIIFFIRYDDYFSESHNYFQHYISLSNILNISHHDGLTKSSITVKANDGYTISARPETKEPIIASKVKFRFRRHNSDASGKDIATYISSNLGNSPKKHLDELYQNLGVVKKAVEPQYKNSSLESFEEEIQAERKYRELIKNKEDWERIIEQYNSVKNMSDKAKKAEEVFIPSPHTFPETEVAKSTYQDLLNELKYTTGHLQERRKKLNQSIKRVERVIQSTTGDEFAVHFGSVSAPKEFKNKKTAKQSYDELERYLEQLEVVFEIIQKMDSEQSNIPFDVFLRKIMTEFENNNTPDGKKVEEWHEIATATKEILDFISRVDTNHPSIQEDEWYEGIAIALNEEFPNILRPVRSQIRRMGDTLWNREHLDEYSWQEFETLVGSLYSSLGYDTEVTSETADMGVDVWAVNDNERVAIQAKHYQQGNRVGREPLQKLSSTLAKGDADRIIVITTSSFARTAEDYSDDFGPEIELIDGKMLIDMLNDSELPPPV